MKIIENKNSDLGILLFFEKSQNKYAIWARPKNGLYLIIVHSPTKYFNFIYFSFKEINAGIIVNKPTPIPTIIYFR